MVVNGWKSIAWYPFRVFADFWRWLERDGSWGFRFPTGEIARHVAHTLTESDRRMLLAQFTRPFFQSWWSKGRINPIFYYYLPEEDLLQGDIYHESLFHVEINVEGKRQRANVNFYGGRLYSVELPKPIKFYKGKSVELGKVTQGSIRHSIARAINRLEHGSDEH